ncbi:DUF3324 domain-containing protein [Lacticaseibacillus sp. GG6-2]
MSRLRHYWWLLLLLGWLLPTQPVHADGATFTVTPKLTNQASKQNHDFEFVAKPGTSVALPITVTNTTATTKTIKVSIANLYTGNNGQIGYDPNGPDDDSARYRLASLTGKPQTVHLAGNQSKQVTFTIAVPKTGFAGELAGSVYAIDAASYQGKAAGKMRLRNRFATYIPVILRTNTTYVHPQLKLTKLTAGQSAGSPVVLAQIQNTAPQMFGQLSLDAKVFAKGKQKPLLTRQVNGYAMAPNSHFTFGIVSKTALKAGDYTVELTARSGQRTWHFNQQVHVADTISAEAAPTSHSTSHQMTPTVSRSIVVLIVALSLVAGGLVWLLWRRLKTVRK